MGLWLESSKKSLFSFVVHGDNCLLATPRNKAAVCITFCELKMWPEPGLERNTTQWEVKRVQKALLFWTLSEFSLPWFYCRVFPTSGSSELAVPVDLTPFPLCSYGGGIEPSFISLEKELASCWWLHNTNIGFLSFSFPRLTSPSVIFRRVSLGITEMSLTPDMWLTQTGFLGMVHLGTQGMVSLAGICQGKSGFEGGLFPVQLVEIQWHQQPVLSDISCMNWTPGSFFPQLIYTFLFQISLL